MTKVKKLRNSGKDLKIWQESIGSQKLKNSSKVVFFSFILFSCSSYQEDRKVEYEYPPDNPYPTVMRKAKTSKVLALIAELGPETLKFDCSLRNDSPYYWCGVDGTFKNPDPGLPKKIGATYHRVVNSRGKKVSEMLIERLKKAKQSVFLVTPRGYHIDNDGFGNLMFGIYNENECMDLFRNYDFCPKNAKKLNVFSGEYEEH